MSEKMSKPSKWLPLIFAIVAFAPHVRATGGLLRRNRKQLSAMKAKLLPQQHIDLALSDPLLLAPAREAIASADTIAPLDYSGGNTFGSADTIAPLADAADGEEAANNSKPGVEPEMEAEEAETEAEMEEEETEKTNCERCQDDQIQAQQQQMLAETQRQQKMTLVDFQREAVAANPPPTYPEAANIAVSETPELSSLPLPAISYDKGISKIMQASIEPNWLPPQDPDHLGIDKAIHEAVHKIKEDESKLEVS